MVSDSVTVSWAATLHADRYALTRYDPSTMTAQTIGGSCAGAVTVSPCTETAVPVGQWIYTVTPRVGTNWIGAESLPSTDCGDLRRRQPPGLGRAVLGARRDRRREHRVHDRVR